ncbi:hypothetical protein [Bauldia sp.]|uniref:hypothetical protein n=1 Tax=Bauldia sp. TaxID=2575872 RepID=UPI003BA89CE5
MLMAARTTAAIPRFASSFQARLAILLLVGFALCCATSVAARDLTEANKDALRSKVEGFVAASEAGDWATVIDVIPPKVLGSLAESVGAPVEAIQRVMLDQIAEAMAVAVFEEVAMDLDNNEYGELADGTSYALVPTVTIMAVEGDRFRTSSKTLAIFEGGVWHLMRIGNVQHISMLKQAYPSFVGVEFEGETVEVIE